MGISTRGLRSLSWPFGIGFVVVWNALNFLALWLNGGWGKMYEDPRSFIVLAVTCLSTSLLSFGIVLIPGLRDLVTAEHRLHYYEPLPFLFIGAAAGLMGVLFLIEVL
nr:putative integron gene cassette protein [uncultured bacterium]CAP47921.1 putative integron gene cassette protein [uncultured bacterium]CAP47922.1 putative integron gene cassette protein [uncultured bacterium]